MRISHSSFGSESASTPWLRWSAALAIIPALVTLRGSEGIAHAAEAASGGDETPAAEAAPAETTAAPAAEAKAAKQEAAVAEALVEPPVPPPAGVHPIPATLPPFAQAPASYVEDLGPESFPGRMRGLYGGSLWLEPSFHGLQWPFMAHTGIGISGNVWTDLGYQWIKRGQDPSSASAGLMTDSQMSILQSRGVLRLTPTYVHGSFFIQGQIEAVGNACQVQATTNTACAGAGTFSTDDLWIRFGQWNSWDVKVGRFEAWEIYHLGMGLDQYTLERLGPGMFGVDPSTTPKLELPSFYGVNYLHDRPADGLATGYAAFHGYLTDSFRVELLGKLGNDTYRTDNVTGDTPYSYYGARPAAILDLGWLKFKVGYEYMKRSPTTQTIEPGQPSRKKDAVSGRTQSGFGASVQFVLAPIVEFGVNVARGKQEDKDGMARTVVESSFTTTSVGGFANLRLTDLSLLGLGTNWTSQTDQFVSGGNNDYTSNWQNYVAFQYLLGGQLFIKGVLAYEQAYFQPADTNSPTWKNNMMSARVRLMYLF